MKTRIQKIIARSLPLCLATALLGASAQAATTLVILEDAFTAPNTWGGYLTGRTPDTVSLTGTTWNCVWLASDNTNMQPYVHSSGSVRTRFNGAAYIDISSTGSYEKPTTLTISADLTISGLTGGSTDGIGLGFYSSTPAQSGGQSVVGFTGFVLSPNGTLNLMSNGAATSYSATIPDFSTTTTYNLSYSIDTTTGGVTSVSLGSTDLSSTFSSVTGVFTEDSTVYAGFFGRSGTYDTSGNIDNFTLTTVIPEVSAIWLIAPVFAFTYVLKRRRK